MTSFLQIALSNVVFAALLAMVALAVSRLWKNQHVVHLLWVIVLAKLVTPPLWNVPLPIVGEVVGPATSASVSFDSRASDAFEESAAAVLPDVAEPVETVIDLGVEEAGPSATPIAHAATSQPVLLVDSAQLDWPVILTSMWLATAVMCALVVVWRVVRFHRLAKQGELADAELAQRVGRLAGRLGLKQLPDVRLLDAEISPMVWPLSWRRLLLLPRQLVAELTPAQLDTVIAHELAHLVRRDELVRLLETVVTCLFWWNPMVWFARRELRAAEEDCCDALVVCSLPESRQQYGEALLRAAEMVTFGRSLPALASGFGQQRFLKRRIEMILKHKFHRSASWQAKLALLILALVVLPLAATVMSQEQPVAMPSEVSDRETRSTGQTSENPVGDSERHLPVDVLLSLDSGDYERLGIPDLRQSDTSSTRSTRIRTNDGTQGGGDDAALGLGSKDATPRNISVAAGSPASVAILVNPIGKAMQRHTVELQKWREMRAAAGESPDAASELRLLEQEATVVRGHLQVERLINHLPRSRPTSETMIRAVGEEHVRTHHQLNAAAAQFWAQYKLWMELQTSYKTDAKFSAADVLRQEIKVLRSLLDVVLLDNTLRNLRQTEWADSAPGRGGETQDAAGSRGFRMGPRAAEPVAKVFPDMSPKEQSQLAKLLGDDQTMPIQVSPHAEERVLQKRLLETEVEIAEEMYGLARNGFERLNRITDNPSDQVVPADRETRGQRANELFKAKIQDQVDSARADMLIKARQMERARIILELLNLQAKRMSDEEARRVRIQRLQQSDQP